MINRRADHHTDTTTVTFSLDEDRPVSVVADVNHWDPLANPMRLKSSGLRSAVITVPSDTEIRFRYLADGGDFFDDPDADALEPNGYGGTNGVIRLAG